MKRLHDTDQGSLSTNESFENAAKVLEVGHLVFSRLCQRVFSTKKRNNPKRNTKNRPFFFMKLPNQKFDEILENFVGNWCVFVEIVGTTFFST